MILFFYGEETYNSSQNIKQLKKKFLKKNPTGGGLIEFDCNEHCDILKITQAFCEQNLFAQKKFIIIRDIFKNTKAPEQKQVIEVLNRGIEDVVIFVEDGNVRKNATLFKWLNENAQTVKQNNLLEGYQLEKWVVKKINKEHKKIDNDAVRELIMFVGNDLWKLSQEIEKLIVYTDAENIIIQDVRDIVCGKVNANMFEMIEAVASENTDIAITLFRKQRVAGDDVFHMFSMYAYQIRVLLNVGSAINEGISNKEDIAKTLKLHPFVVQKTMTMLEKLSYDKIVSMHHELTKIDFNSKTGNYDIEPALELFIVNK